jgi:DNA gyrase subunit A
VPNFDGRLVEPTVLPSRFPNLLCNGGSGIAVGMATNIPPHNLGEVIDALTLVVRDPEVSVAKIMEVLPGPDFPTGGIICGKSNLRRAYEKGRGLITVRSRVEIEERDNGRFQIAITEIPYQITKTKVIECIVECVKTDRIAGISDVRDESDQKGQRLVVEIKRGDDPNVVLNQLFKFTPLQSTYSIINIALIDSQPRTLSIKEILTAFIQHRFVVIRRRTAFLLRKAEARAHILEGLLRALDIIDEIIAVIKASANPREAGENLMARFGFSEPQATHIRQMQLQTLTGLERERLREEHRLLMVDIENWRRVMAEDALVYTIMCEEWAELRKKYGDERRTTFSDDVVEMLDEDLVADDSMVITVTRDGYIKRTPLVQYRSQGRGGKGVRASDVKEGDVVRNAFVASNHNYLLFFTNTGRVLWLKVYQLPEVDRTSRGRAIVNLLELGEGETIAQELCLEELAGGYLFFATRRGVVKRTELAAYSRPLRGGIRAIELVEGDELIGVERCTDADDILLVTENGQANRFAVGRVRPMGRIARGVRGISLRAGDRVVALAVARENQFLLTVTRNGYGKRTLVAEYLRKNRGGLGVRNIQTPPRNGPVVAARVVEENDEIVLITVGGQIIRSPVASVSAVGRSTMGVRVIKLHEGDAVAAVERISEETLRQEVAGAQPPGRREPTDEEIDAALDRTITEALKQALDAEDAGDAEPPAEDGNGVPDER